MLQDLLKDLFNHSKVIIKILIKYGKQCHFNEFTLLSDDIAVIILLVIVKCKAPHASKMLLLTRNLDVHQPNEMMHKPELFLNAQSDPICSLER